MRTLTVLEDVPADPDGWPLVRVHCVTHEALPRLLGGEDAAEWLLAFGWFGSRWHLVDSHPRA